jgi:hypothetical protein
MWWHLTCFSCSCLWVKCMIWLATPRITIQNKYLKSPYITVGTTSANTGSMRPKTSMFNIHDKNFWAICFYSTMVYQGSVYTTIWNTVKQNRHYCVNIHFLLASVDDATCFDPFSGSSSDVYEYKHQILNAWSINMNSYCARSSKGHLLFWSSDSIAAAKQQQQHHHHGELCIYT